MCDYVRSPFLGVTCPLGLVAGFEAAWQNHSKLRRPRSDLLAFRQQAKVIKKQYKTVQEKSAPSVINSLSPALALTVYVGARINFSGNPTPQKFVDEFFRINKSFWTSFWQQ